MQNFCRRCSAGGFYSPKEVARDGWFDCCDAVVFGRICSVRMWD